MQVALSEEHLMLQTSVRDILARSLRASTAGDGVGSSTDRALAGLGEAGMFGALVPEQRGGVGLGALAAALIAEAAGEHVADAPVAAYLVGGYLLGKSDVGDADSMLAALLRGSLRLALAVEDTPPEKGGGERDTRILDGRVHGAKRCVPFAGSAKTMLVSTAGDRVALVDPRAPEVDLVKRDTLDGLPDLYDVTIGGAAGVDLALPSTTWERARGIALMMYAGEALGAASALLARTITHVSERRQFGRPLSMRQAVRHDLADMAAMLESARSLLWYAGALLDENGPSALRTICLAKAHITDVALQAARRCIVLHGAIGFAAECDAHLYLKRTMSRAMLLGTPRALRLEAICSTRRHDLPGLVG